jgi:hypothetical protein
MQTCGKMVFNDSMHGQSREIRPDAEKNLFHMRPSFINKVGVE